RIASRLATARIKPIQQFGSPPIDLERPRKHSSAIAASFHARLHGLPDTLNTGARLFIWTPMHFIGAHDVSDGALMFFAKTQQICPATERPGQLAHVGQSGGKGAGLTPDIALDHETTAHGIVASLH